ncbi:hypothetical protein D3C85_393940 [compost metagenome]
MAAVGCAFGQAAGRVVGVAEGRVHRGARRRVDIDAGVVALHDGTRGQEAEPEAEAHGGVHVFRRRNAAVDQVEGLARQRVLQAVGQKAGQILLDLHGHAAAAPHEGDQRVRAGIVAGLAQHHFHQRHQVRGHEEVQAQHAAPGLQALADRADRKAGTVAGQDGVRPGAPRQVREERLLDVQAFGDALDHQVHGGPVHLVQRGRGGQQRGVRFASDGLQVLGDAGGQACRALGIRLDDRRAAGRAGQHHRHVGAHRAAADHHRMRRARVGQGFRVRLHGLLLDLKLRWGRV